MQCMIHFIFLKITLATLYTVDQRETEEIKINTS